MNQNYQIENQPELKEKTGWGFRNKIITFLIIVILLIVVGLVIFFLQGGNFNTLADRADYIASDPSKAGRNFVLHGQIKGQSGQICGIVSNVSGEVVIGAKVEIVNERVNWSTQTDSGGQYCIPPLETEALKVIGETLVGDYTLKTTAESYQPQEQQVTVASAEEKKVNFILTSISQDLLPDVY